MIVRTPSVGCSSGEVAGAVDRSVAVLVEGLRQCERLKMREEMKILCEDLVTGVHGDVGAGRERDPTGESRRYCGERSWSAMVDGCCRLILMNGSMWMLLVAAMSILTTTARRIHDIARYRAIGVVLGWGVGKSGTADAAVESV